MTFSTEVKIQCVVWLQQLRSPIKVQRKYQTTYGRRKQASPSTNMIRKWSNAFEKTGSITKAHKRKKTVDQEKIIKDFQENPKQSLRRASHKLGVCVSSVRNSLKKAGFRRYMPRIVQALQDGDPEARVEFAESVLDKLRTNPNFLKMIMFSDEAIFHLEGGVNRQNSSHWGTSNPQWLVEKSLNSPRVMVWAAVGEAGVIGPIFFTGNVDAESYLKLLEEEFFPVFSGYRNQSKLVFQQDGAPPHWAKRVRDCLNDRLPHRWIGRGGPRDSNIPWPPRSPDLTPMDFFVWGFIKSKVYTKNYRNLVDLKAAIRSAFQLITKQMVSDTLDNLERRLQLVVLNGGRHVEMQ